MSDPSADAIAPARIPARRNLALLAGVSLLAAASLAAASHASGWASFAGWVVVFAGAGNTLFALLHESVHGLVHPSRTANEWAGRIAAAWFPTGLAMQRAYHLTHHRNNRSAAEQFDVLRAGDIAWLKRAQWYAILTGLYWWVALAGLLAYLVTPRALRERLLRAFGAQAARQTSADAYLAALDALPPLRTRLEILGSLAAQVALCVALDVSLLAWLACYGAFGLVWSSLQYTDHAFSPLDPREGAWDLVVSAPARAIFLNYPLHRAHHAHPQAPWNALPRLADAGPRFADVWLAAWRGPRRPADFPRFALHEPARPLLAWPAPDERPVLLALASAFLFVFVIGYGGASLLSGLVPWRLPIAFPAEAAIALVPGWSLVYLSLIPLLMLLPFVLRTARELFPVFAALVLETAVACVAFVLWPAEVAYPAADPGGPWAGALRLADILNLERNAFPSLHVAFAVTAALAIGRRAGGLWIHAWAAAIAVSTLLTHQHHVADVIGGGLLAAIAWRLVSEWLRRPGVAQAVDVELICLANALAFARRHRRYATIALALVAASAGRWRERRVLRTGFCFLQAVDDLLDGDRTCAGEPLGVVGDLVQSLRSGRFAGDALGRLARAFVEDLHASAGSSAVATAVELIEVMQRDRRRVLDAARWSAAAIAAQHRATFTRSLDLMLAAFRAEVRAADVPELIDALGWCSTMRDLREDLARGLVNVPAEVLDAAGAARDVDALLATPAMTGWIAAERVRAIALLDAAERRLAALEERRGAKVLGLFARSIRGFALRRHPRLYPATPAPAGP